MTNSNDIGNSSTWVAIDIAQRRNEVLIQRPGRKRYRMSMTNDRADHDRLVRHLQRVGGSVEVAFEATGNYHRTLAWRLISAGFHIHLISSVALARIREALHNSWDKHDAKDAQVILHMLSAGNVQHYHDPLVQGLNDWQELSKTHEAISKAKTEVLHRLKTHYLPLYFPEIDRFRNSSRAEWFFRFLYEFPTPAAITRLSRDEFVAASWKLVGRKVNKKRFLSDIYETARCSTALPVPTDSAAVAMFRLVLLQMRQLIQHRDAIEAEALQRVGDHNDFQRLRQIPGIGPIHALTILAEAGDLRRFDHYRQFLKFCGFNLANHQSGQFRGQAKLSKYGNARLRKAFWMAAQVAVRQRENNFRDKYRRYVRRDPDDADLKRKALTAVAAKVARVAYAIIKHDTDYRPLHGVR